MGEAAGLPKIAMSVNVSALQFRSKGLLKSITAILDETGLAPEALNIEVTECGKRPEFPSGMTSGFRATMSSWLMSKKRERVAAFAGSERFLRSGGLRN
jgi:hypothetical protein